MTGPNVLNQILTVATGYGHVARCGCGWRSLHDDAAAAIASGQRHLRTHNSQKEAAE